MARVAGYITYFKVEIIIIIVGWFNNTITPILIMINYDVDVRWIWQIFARRKKRPNLT